MVSHGEMGRIVSDNSPRNLASEISALLRQPEGNGQRIKTRRDRMTEFSWATIADRILQEYNRLLGD
jgi:glycosyltransferase involved in cell wall biosynthesis